MTAAVREIFATKPAEFDPRKYLGPARDSLRELYKHKLTDVLGSANTVKNKCLSNTGRRAGVFFSTAPDITISGPVRIQLLPRFQRFIRIFTSTIFIVNNLLYFCPPKIIDTQMRKLRNIAIIAHVDHGKTTLVDKMIFAGQTIQRKRKTKWRFNSG